MSAAHALSPAPWRGQPRAIDGARWVVLDVESSGLDADARPAAGDRRASPCTDVPARPRIDLGDSFEVVLRQDRERRRQGQHPGARHRRRRAAPTASSRRRRWRGFERWLGGSPLIGFHADFDETLIQRAMRRRAGPAAGATPGSTWPVAAVVHPTGQGPHAGRMAGALRHPLRACATRRRPTRWPRPNCCSSCGPRPGPSGASRLSRPARLAAQRRWLQR